MVHSGGIMGSGKLAQHHVQRFDSDIDRGCAWVVMIAVASWNVLIAGTLKSFGVIYLEYEELFHRGPVVTAWLGFSFSFLITVLAPFSGYFSDQVGLRTMRVVVVVLGAIASVAIALTGWMPILEGAIVTYGVAGLCASIIDSPVLGLVGHFFVKRRFLATAVAFSGSSLGTLILPPLFTLLVKYYAIRGAMLVFAGLWMNTLAIGAVIRPPRRIVPPTADDTEKALEPSTNGKLSSSDKNAKEAESEKSKPSPCIKAVVIVKDFIDFLRTPGLPLLVLTFCFSSFAYFNQLFIFPPFAHEMGMSKLEGAWLVSVANIVELVSRLLVGVLTDQKKVQKTLLIQVSFLLSFVVGVIFSFFPYRVSLYVYASIYGMLGGIFIPLAIPLMVELVSEHQLSSAAGMHPFYTGIGISIGPPILGAVKEWTGTFANSLRVCACCYFIALILFMVQSRSLHRCLARDRHRPAFVETVVKSDNPAQNEELSGTLD